MSRFLRDISTVLDIFSKRRTYSTQPTLHLPVSFLSFCFIFNPTCFRCSLIIVNLAVQSFDGLLQIAQERFDCTFVLAWVKTSRRATHFVAWTL